MTRFANRKVFPARLRLTFGVMASCAIMAVAGGLSGCANIGDSFASGAFVDPARYDYYDCERLKAERVSLVAQANAKQALIDKASTGTGGAIIGEAVYRNDYIALRAQKKLADEAWVRSSCDAVTLPDEVPKPAAATPPVAAPAAVKPAPKPR